MATLPFIPTGEIDEQVLEEGDEHQTPLDLNRLLLPRPASTFLLRSGVNRYGVRVGDILVVDRSVYPGEQKLVIAPVEGKLMLVRYPAPEVWGVVTYVIRTP